MYSQPNISANSFKKPAYCFGFNGKEKDQDGEFGLTAYDYGFRIYNPGIAKFLSVDPLTKDYPWWTPYQFAGNTPIMAIDLDGLEILDYKSMFHLNAYTNKSVTYYTLDPNGENYKGGASITKRAVHGAYKIGDATDYYKNKLLVSAYAAPLWESKANFTVGGEYPYNSIPLPNKNSNITNHTRDQIHSKMMASRELFPTEGDPNDFATNSYNNVQAIGGGLAWGITQSAILVYRLGPQASTIASQSDINTMIEAYPEALSFLNENQYSKDLINRFTGDKAQFTADLANYLVDKSMPNSSVKTEYRNMVKKLGEIFISNYHEVNTKRKLKSDKILK